MPQPRKTVAVPRREAVLSLDKAEQFLAAAKLAAESSRSDATLLNAVHAAISAADAVTVALTGRRSADPDHQRAADLLREAGVGSETINASVKQLRSLLAKKNQVEYESRRASAKEAADALARAGRFVEWAGETVRRARL